MSNINRHSETSARSEEREIKFGTDGWRAIIGETFTFANVEKVSYAIGSYIQSAYGQNNPSLPILIGYDTRFMAEQFAERSARVLMAMGLNVKITERDIPTPCIAWATQAETTGGALQFTASHNPPEYCGVKYIPPYAGPATTDITVKIVANLKHCPEQIQLAAGDLQFFDASAPYMEAVKTLVDFDKISKSGLKIAYDALYSTSRGYMDKLIIDAGLEPVILHNFRDPLFGGGMPEPRPAYLKELIATIKAGDFDLGIATDGDADRFAIIDGQGHFFTPNQLLCLLTRHLVKNHRISGAIVRTVATSHMLNHVAAKYDLPLFETPVGFKYIGEKMRTEDVLIGGEESGGVSIKGHIPEKDGILANLLVIEMLAYEKKPLAQIWADLEAEIGVKFFQARGDLHLTATTQKLLLAHLADHPVQSLAGQKLLKIDRTDGIKLYYDQDNWLLLRPSGTEPVIRVSGEGTSVQLIDSLMVDFKRQIDEILKSDKTLTAAEV